MRPLLIVLALLVITPAGIADDTIPTVRVIGAPRRKVPKAPVKPKAPKAPKLPAIPARAKRANVRSVSDMEVSGVNEAFIYNPFCKGSSDGSEDSDSSEDAGQ